MLIAFEWKIKIKSLYFIWKVDFLRTPNCNPNWTNSLQKSACNINWSAEKKFIIPFILCQQNVELRVNRSTLFKWYGYKCILISDRFNLHFSNILTWPTSKSVDSLNEIPIYTQKRRQNDDFYPNFFFNRNKNQMYIWFTNSAHIQIESVFEKMLIDIQSSPLIYRPIFGHTNIYFSENFLLMFLYVVIENLKHCKICVFFFRQ